MYNKVKQIRNLVLSVIVGLTLFSVAYAADVKPNHPRIFLTDDVLARLEQKVDNDVPEWQELKSEADEILTETFPLGGDYQGSSYYEAIQSLGLVYQLTGDTAYSDKVIEAMQKMADTVGIDVIKGDMGYGIRNYGPAMALGYDWCYEQLTDEQKIAYYETLNLWLDFYPGGFCTGDPEVTGCYQHDGPALGNYFSGYFLALGLASYATYGDNPKAQEYIDKARDFFENLIREAADNGEMRGGDDPEGGYAEGYYQRIFYYLLAVKSATGEDIIADGFNWPEEVVYSHIYRIKPQMDLQYDFGNWHSDYPGPVVPTPMLILSDIFKEAKEGGYAKYYANHIIVTEDWDRASAFDKMLFYDSETPEEMWDNEPLSYFAPGSSLVTMRSGWDQDAIWASFQGGADWFVDHQDNDKGHFSIQRGDDYLVIDSDQVWGLGGHVTNTGMGNTTHNSILVYNTEEYALTYPPFQGYWGDPNQVEAFEDGDDYLYTKSNVTSAYSGPPGGAYGNPLSNFHRLFVYIRPDYFIVFDRVSTKKDYYTPAWALHLGSEPVISGDTVIATVGDSKIFSKTLLPENFAIELLEDYLDYDDEEEAPDYGPRIEVKPQQPSLDDLFLHVLYPTGSSTASMPPIARIDGTTMVGAQIEDRVVMFSRTETTLEEGQFAISGPGVYRIMVCDLEESTPYYVSLDGGAEEPYSTTESGLLVFDLDLAEGDHTVAISISQKTKYGDVSGDGNITAFDALLILKVVVGILSLNDPSYPYLTLERADVSGNRMVSALDAALVLQYCVGLITEFPCRRADGAPALNPPNETRLLTKAIEQLEGIPLTKEQKQVLEQLKRQISKRILPKSSALLQNYPNPFNPETWIPFKLSQSAPVIISIYDTKGQLIRSLHIGLKDAGVYVTKGRAAYWNGRNNAGEKVASGVYFYTITAGDFTKTRRMFVVK